MKKNIIKEINKEREAISICILGSKNTIDPDEIGQVYKSANDRLMELSYIERCLNKL